MKNSTPFLSTNYKLVAAIFFLAVFTNIANAQDYQTDDTVHVQEVVISGESISRFQSGAKIEKIPAKQFELAQDGSLEQLLSRTTPISLKANAGALSTIRIRGTAPDHTSINFGGININSLTLGHSNVSNVPMYLFDEVAIQYGSSSSVNGSGNIGGAIHLGLKNYWVKGFKAEVRTAHGSFGEQLYGTKIFLGNGKFESVSRAYYYYKNNNFTYINPNVRDFENQIFEVIDTQHNANIENMGIMQELNYKFAEKEVLLFKVWLENDWHFIQQKMQTNIAKPNYQETYQNKHIRIWADYKNRKNAFKYQFGTGYVNDNSIHKGNARDAIKTERFIGNAFIEHDFINNASYKIGTKAARIYPKVYAYPVGLDYEDRIDLYASYNHTFFNKLKATANIRKGFVTNFTIPFTPSLGVNYIALSKEKYILNISGNIAKSYRVPTFNDRFWIPGGNPDLEPEHGMSYEAGAKLSYCDNNVFGNLKVNLFYMDINEWILWLPGDTTNSMGWYAENIQNVVSKGFELMVDVNYTLYIVKMHSGINYTLTSTQRKASKKSSNAINRQLEYVPLHSGNFFTTVTHKKISISIDANYIHEQYTNEEEKNIIDPYVLLNFALSYNLKINNNNKIRINGMVNNILNTNYISDWEYAMPRINYRISLTYNFK